MIYNDLNDKIEKFEFNNYKITNYEMESSAIYGLANILGHKGATICAIIANRITKDACADYKKTMKELIKYTLDQLTK